jgi:hypothetical protein
MIDIPHEFEHLASREGFNKALSHFRTVSGLIEDFEGKTNIADILNEVLSNKEITSKQIVPIVHAILIDKYGYTPHSHTLSVSISDFSYFLEQVGKWKALDITLVYFHPDLGPLALNPKNPEHFSSLNSLRENELITLYFGAFGAEPDEKIVETAKATLIKFLEGKQVKNPDSLLRGSFSFKPAKKEEPKKPAKRTTKKTPGRKPKAESRRQEAVEKRTAEQAPGEKSDSSGGGGARRMTPYYSVPVTNELFHNGNVEAWKKIIQSYNTTHPDLEVYIYYDGERIHDIASLFKWGKVKHGSAILFSVAGEEIKDVAKLQRYLRQGASHQFEAFLRAPANKILNLF